MKHATISEKTANIILEALVKDRVQNALNGVFQDIKEKTDQAPPMDQEVTRFALLNMIDRVFREIMEEQRRRTRICKGIPLGNNLE